MAVFLLNANHDLLAATVRMLGLADGEVDCLAPVMAVTHNAALLVYNIPAIHRLIMVDMERAFRTGLLLGITHLSAPEAPC